MKKTCIMAVILLIIGLSACTHQTIVNTEPEQVSETKKPQYIFPEFYRGFYLTSTPVRNMEQLKVWVERAKRANMNCMVIDVQNSRLQRVSIPQENIQYLLDNGIHPIARIVIFADGLSVYPPPAGLLQDRYDAAIAACEIGFKEIQFDYIRFNDSNVVKLPLEQRYAFIEGILKTLREKVAPYNVRTAADVFGRIPLNRGDIIGQRMESLDTVVDIIAPMAYPSHYTWDRGLQHNPYKTVLMTSQRAVERVKHAKIVTWIQTFEMRLGPHKYPDYVRMQMQAVYDSGASGYLMWNARNVYNVPFQVAEEFYRKRGDIK